VPTPLALPEDEEKRRILEALHRWNGNRALAAEALGISRTTLWRKLKTWQEG
jgi:transcriptional regulator of acetoin/glycerol metabolism